VVQTLHPPLIRWLPNAISIARALLIPIGLWLAEEIRSARLGGELAPSLPLATLILALGVSDLVDGWIARRFGVTTRAGATLDAVADKMAQFSFVAYFTFREIPSLTQLPLWYFGIVFLRDLLLAIGYLTLLRYGRVDTEHRSHGKISSLLLFLVILSVASDLPAVATIAACWVSAAVIAVSTALYLHDGTIILRRHRSPAAPPSDTSRAG
jgi:phosphatidylglycerophosphate synthase